MKGRPATGDLARLVKVILELDAERVGAAGPKVPRANTVGTLAPGFVSLGVADDARFVDETGHYPAILRRLVFVGEAARGDLNFTRLMALTCKATEAREWATCSSTSPAPALC